MLLGGTAALAFALAGCTYTPSYTINKPLSGSSIVCTDPLGMGCQVPLDIQWRGVQVKPQPDLTLDGVVLPPTTLTQSTTSSVGTLTVPLGGHTLLVAGDLTGNNTLQHVTATSSFTVTAKPPPTGGFSLVAPATDVLVERGKCATVLIAVSRTAPFTGPVVLSLGVPPPGITAAAVTVTGPSGTLSICAAAGAALGKVTVGVTGTGTGVPSAGTPVKLIIGRQVGPFLEANPTPYLSTLPSSRPSLTQGFRVDIRAGAGLPQPRMASFFDSAGTQVGPDIGFTLGPASNIGGAGFCANSAPLALTRGVVLSGALPGFSSQNVFTFLDLTASSPRLIQQPADMQVQPSTGTLYVFQPRVFFSQDCTLALVASANPIGPSKNTLRVLDLVSGQPIGAEVPFDTNIFSALLRNNGQKQEVEVKADTGTSTATTTVIPMP